MERKSRLAVFEHVNQKEQTKNVGTKVKKRPKSPETTFEEGQANKSKIRKKGIQANVEQLTLFCRYENCNFLSDKYSEYLKHLEAHVQEVPETEEDLECVWEKCSFKAADHGSLRQHVSFHGYLERLASVGAGLVDSMSLPVCALPPLAALPTQPPSYCCTWADCDACFLTYHAFLHHIKCHINCREDNYRCKWQGCKNKYGTVNKLQEHVRTHTKEKVVCCPTCGASFASRTKFIDHRKRQLSSELQGYQCSQCSKLFASERLLRDHMRVHINHYKCHLCDMTCSKPSMLAKHIRYRHLPDRPFTCKVCQHRTVSRQDLVAHARTHDTQAALSCERRGCDFSCRSKWALVRHRATRHDRNWAARYACHCCPAMFTRGAILTKHLIRVHDFHWPSGHSRFLYKQDTRTGLFHLQLVRYESLEVTQEMMGNEAASVGTPALTSDVRYECTNSPGDPFTYELKIAQPQPSSENMEVLRAPSRPAKPPNNDGDSFKYEFIDVDNPAYESDDTDNLIICG